MEEELEPGEGFAEVRWSAVLADIGGLSVGSTEHGAEHEVGGRAGIGLKELGMLDPA